MKNIKVLDCTLRDGGYINEFNFGKTNIKRIIRNLNDANIDVVECGFLKKDSFNPNSALFGSIDFVNEYLKFPKSSLFVAMIQLGKFDVSSLPQCSNNGIGGIRLTFHKYEIDQAIKDGETIINKGYKLFFQPVGTTSYSSQELGDLIERVNVLNPFAFYIVDTLGLMFESDVLDLFSFVNERLRSGICLGFHSHNNLQLSFSNAQSLFKMQFNREVFIDCSLYGMGRGAGNLCTELLCSFLNKKGDYKYDLSLLIQTIDYFIAPLKNNYQWGYSIAYYLSSINNCHPNYASYLLNKQTLRIADISSILESLDESAKDIYDESLIKKVYFEFLNNKASSNRHNNDLDNLACIFKNRNILLLAPGPSVQLSVDKINSFIKSNNCLVVSINKNVSGIKSDYIFVSNSKKFDIISSTIDSRIIATSNINNIELSKHILVDYNSLKIDDDDVKDNAGLMCIKLMNLLSVNNIYLAGFDGFSADDFSYMFSDIRENEKFANNINAAMKREMNKFHENLFFITKSLYE